MGGKKQAAPAPAPVAAPVTARPVTAQVTGRTAERRLLTPDEALSAESDIFIQKRRKGKRSLTIEGQAGTTVPTSTGETSGINIPM